MNSTVSFRPPNFNSAPWCLNGHFHTILASLLFKAAELVVERRYIETPDGDFLELDVAEQTENRPFVILLHGLEGSSERYYIRNIARHLFNSGFSIAALNFRSCGSGLNRTRRFYHSGETGDLETISAWLQETYPGSLQLAAGFSLGGSVLLNYLAKRDAARIVGFAAISVPYDLHRGSLNLQKGFNRIYDRQFLISLNEKLDQKRAYFPDLPEFNGSTLFEFDDQVTAPVHGFKDAEEYYRLCSSAFFMDRVLTPGILIHSREDPLCPFDTVPQQVIEENPSLYSLFPDRGGHVGFWSMPRGWVEQTVALYFRQLLRNHRNE